MESVFHLISKEEFFNTIDFDNKTLLIQAVKKDWNRLNIFINNVKTRHYHEFLLLLKAKYKNYLEIMLCLSNQNVHYYMYRKLFNILSRVNYHVITDKSCAEKNLVATHFNITPVIKQAIIVNSYNITKDINKKPILIIKVFTIINLVTYDPIIIKIEFSDT
jgi:hypothetical protein